MYLMQLRMKGLVINECPSFLAPDENIDNHSIYLPAIKMRICLDLHRVTSFFYVRKPTETELAHLPI